MDESEQNSSGLVPVFVDHRKPSQPNLQSENGVPSSGESHVNSLQTTTGEITSNTALKGSNSNRDKKGFKRILVGLLIVLILILLGAVLGVAMSRRGSSSVSSTNNSNAAGPSPTIDNGAPDSQPDLNTPSPQVMPSPATTRCQQQKTALLDCGSPKYAEGELDLCLGCVSNISTYESCTTYCPDFTQCGCLFCLDELEAWAECATNCTIDCSTEPTPAPQTTAICTAEQDTADECLVNDSGLTSDQAEACVHCTVDAANAASIFSCSAFLDDFCSDFSYCNCGSCSDLMVQYIDCAVSDSQCGFQCSDSNDPCASKLATSKSCVNKELSTAEGSSCADCVNSALDAASFASTCSEYISEFCPEFDQCSDCGACLENIEEWVSCAVGGDQCAIACGNTSQACSTEDSAFTRCLDNKMTALQRYSCSLCAQNALDRASLDTCEEFNADFCPAIILCQCGSCSDEVIDLVDCLVDLNDQCSLNCSDANSTLCSGDQAAYQDCLNSQLSTSQADSCSGCVDDALKAASYASCSSFASTFCPNFNLCRCGPCTNELEQKIECLLGEACVVDCASANQSAYTNTRLCPEDSGVQQDGYQICLDLNITSDDVSVFRAASTSWSNKIVGDLSPVQSAGYDPRFACSEYPEVIDDLYICGTYDNIDGVGGVLGQSTFVYNRLNNSLPSSGIMTFDNADVDELKAEGTFQGVILHEMGHVVGIGTMWELIRLIGSVDEGCPYKGANANREWQSLSGCASAIPIEQQGGQGTACSHWDEACLEDELMTGALGNAKPIFSNITIAALKDLGYSVNYSKAENFSAANINPSCLCNRRSLLDHEVHVEAVSAHERRRLSAEGYRIAHEHGQRHLSRMREVGRTARSKQLDGVEFVGDKVVSVLYKEEGRIYSVRVSSE